ncbi:hypothetical protein LTR96_010624 [Exophiala xenobiotica]|uniref:C2H2-type domain-containing protein n=1 Tax=Vermiconidia calcicola TaxID=1690605 RepID=A0AAV9Q5C2_9PEZI|nr:hypothetical protein LTR96_010624 [Exophiala xenobiotica]KAK5342332.1 hypothetical protein LTR98_003126 [Exophiala xenobiotica]KAK5534123.1 hypothetical protein LTR25_007103 [Vermiconidia calcicola]
MQNDPGVPFDPTLEQKHSLEKRRDVTERTKDFDALQKSGPKADTSRAKGLFESLRQRLYALVVADSREKDFPPPSFDHAALDINGSVELFAGHTLSDNGKPSKEFIFDDHAKERSDKAITWLLSYMAKAWTCLAAPGSPTSSRDHNLPEQKPIEQKSPGKPTCFVCKTDFERRWSLTRHVKKHHLQLLSTAFQCPECIRLGLPPHTTRSPPDWSNHTDTVHGKMHAPYLTVELSSECAVAQDCAVAHDCFVCRATVPASRAGAIKHYGRHTAVLSSEQLFFCLECIPSKDEGAKPASYLSNEMLYHLSEKYSHPDIARWPLYVWYGSVRGLNTHVRGHFRKDSVPCRMCDAKDATFFDGYDSWYSHRELAHDQDGLFGLKAPKQTEDQ